MTTISALFTLVREDYVKPVNETLGYYSELFFLLATGAYAVAFIFFAWDLATAYKSSNTREEEREEEKDQREIAALTKEDKSQSQLKENSRQKVGVATQAGKDSKDTGEYNTELGSSFRGPDDRILTRERELDELETASPDMNYSSKASRPWARVAVALTTLAFIIHFVAVICRGLGAGRVPWGNMYEFCTTGALLVVAVFLLLLLKKDIRFVGTFVIGLVLVMLVSARMGFYVPVGHLVPALNSYWLVIHVSIAILASAIFTITFALSVLQLLQMWRLKKLDNGQKDPLKIMKIIPSSQTLEDTAYRLNAFGFILWTVTVVFGAIWAHSAWGRYWGWDPKEVWSFVIWVVYAAYLHARATKGWTGARSAWLSIIGYLCVIFSFTVVNVFFSGLHSYSGLS